jgi:putative transposase
MNRSARRLPLFERQRDYALFSEVLRDTVDRFGMRILSYVVMPNHWHLVVWPVEDGDLSTCMAWMTATHVRRWHLSHESVGTGGIYQGRYKALAVQQEAHFYTVCRYVERNPVRAGLAARPSEWRWSSAWPWPSLEAPRLCDWPVARPSTWAELVEREQPPEELNELRQAVARSRPLGSDAWAVQTAASIGWTTGMRRRGRPNRVASTDLGDLGVGMNFGK